MDAAYFKNDFKKDFIIFKIIFKIFLDGRSLCSAY